MKRTAIIVSGDAGGAAAVAPVASRLATQGLLRLRTYAGPQAFEVLRQRGLSPILLDAPAAAVAAARRLSPRSIAVVVASTSVGVFEPEKVFIAAALKVGIPSLAVLDYWSSYVGRFSDRQGRLIFLPDRIAVMDPRAAREAARAGIPRDRLVVTGAPQLDDLADLRDRAGAVDRAGMRRALGATESDMVLLYVPGPLRVPFLRGIGFSEREVVGMVVEALSRIAKRRNRPVVFALRPHPREGRRPRLPPMPSGVRMALAIGGSAREWALASDAVAGTHSIALLEAAYLGCIALSIQPGLSREDTLPTNAVGVTIPIYHSADVITGLDRALFDHAFRRSHRARLASVRPRRGATARVTRIIHALAGIADRP